MAQKNADRRGEFVILGASRGTFRDLYHLYLRAPWWMALGAIVLTFLTANVLFGVIFYFSDGIAHMRPGSFQDAFFFSVQTMATIGYGDMHPVTPFGNVVVVCEAVVGLLFSAVATGLVFAKVSQPTARVVFSRHAVISPIDGVPHLQFRLGNQRGNQILEAQLRVTLMRKERTLEGIVLYRMYELPLVRDRSSAFTRSWLAMHKIDDKSLLFGATPESVERDEVELITSVVGTDDTSLQPMHARHNYESDHIVFGARHVDILSESEDGTFVVDLHKFHDVKPSEPTATFPYPRRARAELSDTGEFDPG